MPWVGKGWETWPRLTSLAQPSFCQDMFANLYYQLGKEEDCLKHGQSVGSALAGRVLANWLWPRGARQGDTDVPQRSTGNTAMVPLHSASCWASYTLDSLLTALLLILSPAHSSIPGLSSPARSLMVIPFLFLLTGMKLGWGGNGLLCTLSLLSKFHII